ncbi:MAG TPA: DUF1553 domain-containing protein [Gemmataceae bacterium]|jgi:hypothetical protein
MKDGFGRYVIVAIFAASGGVGRGAGPEFDRAVAPLLSERCLTCHSGGKSKGGLDLSRRRSAMEGGDKGAVIVPGKPEASLLWEYVKGDKMPPKKPLSATEKKVLQTWIAAGAIWGTDPIDPFRVTTDKRAGYDWWALQPMVRRKPPVTNAHWGRNAIDAFVLHRLEERGLHPALPADRRTLIRRLSFDLLGLPPTPEEVAAFENDPSPVAYERLVDRYLQSPQYGVRWARHWLDVVRFGESNGFEFDEPRPNAWRYRDWVVDALNRDLPYDEFARLQLAGDVLYPDDADAIKATGFLVAGAYDTVGQTQQSEAMKRVVRQDELEDIVGTVGQTFLGLTIHCARCHDHKFDPIRQVEYYRLTAALGGVRHGEQSLPAAEGAIAQMRQRLAALEKERETIERPIRARILAERKEKPLVAPEPMARWDFTRGVRDTLGGLDATLMADAQLVREGLKVDGRTGYAVSAPLRHNLKAKTLEAWVTLDNLSQRGGGVVSVQTKDGTVFDALVFGEIDAGQWLAGSNNFVRTRSFAGPVETEATRRTVHVALVWSEDGMIRGYRDGKPYGKPYKSRGVQAFKAGEAQVLFGLRHAPAGGNRLLAGVIRRVQLYDRALSDAEIAASSRRDFVEVETIAARLPAEQRDRYARLQSEINERCARLARPGGKVYAVVPRQPGIAHLLHRGDSARPGEVVSAGGVDAIAGVSSSFGLSPDAAEGERRKKLAEWITDPKNPLFARAIVNRLWHYHFGIGLVDTPNDFGFNGGRPSHRELLNWLAAELVESGWRLKHLHRLIVTSATYRQASSWTESAARVDADNRLLWRKSPRRMEAETVRDTILYVAGRLSLRMGGPSFQDVRPVRAPGTTAIIYLPADVNDEPLRRRTLYRLWSRGGRNRLLDAFDCPDPSTTAPSRAITTTPLQALAMLNNSFVLHMSRHLAERIEREVGDEVDRQIRRAYLLAYGRPPQDDEMKLARQVVRKHGLQVLARALFNSNEFLYVD